MCICVKKLSTIFIIGYYFSLKFCSAQQNHPDAGLNVLEIIKKYNYPLEIHDVTTEDGYILQMHRIPHGKNNDSNLVKKPVVLLLHCLLCSSAEWIYMGPNRSLGFILADRGYDVWLGNHRGNTWSRRHKYLDPNDVSTINSFWDFSFHEMGVIDNPTFIDYIFENTGNKKLYLIGHSEGTTTAFITLTQRPEYNKKIRLYTALAPAIFQGDSIMMNRISYVWPVLNSILVSLNIWEILPKTKLLETVGNTFCLPYSPSLGPCLEGLYMMVGRNEKQFDNTTVPVILSSTPAGCSRKQITHYIQITLTNKFQMFDYGWMGNLRKYSSLQPPQYDISKVTVPTALYYGLSDTFVGYRGVQNLAKMMTNLTILYKVPDDEWNHLDFLWAVGAPSLLYQKVLSVMERF